MASKVKGIPESLSQANAKFTEDFYRKVSNNDKNVFFSPVSISKAFAMVHLGARGNTAAEIARALSLNETEDVHESFDKLHGIINQNLQKSQLLTANRLFGNDKYKIVESYVQDCLKYYKADLQPLDFSSAEAIGIINDWVSKKTNDKIQDLISDIDPMTVLILVNAIYFKGQWKDPFEKTLTKKAPFYLNENDNVEVEFMFKEDEFPVGFDSGTDSTIVELPYSDENLNMVIFLPNKRNGLKTLEENLTQKLFNILCEPRYSQNILLKIPKFKFEYSLLLNDTLRSLGMNDLFVGGVANLSGIGENLFVSKAIHKAFVEVNEEGTEAAAATAIMMECLCMPSPPKSVNVDHPFLFAIVEKSSKTVLFFGRVMKPEYE